MSSWSEAVRSWFGGGSNGAVNLSRDFSKPDLAGVLMRREGPPGWRTWAPRWCIVQDGYLGLFESFRSKGQPLLVYPLHETSVNLPTHLTRRFAIELVHPRYGALYLQAESQAQRMRWVEVFRGNPVPTSPRKGSPEVNHGPLQSPVKPAATAPSAAQQGCTVDEPPFQPLLDESLLGSSEDSVLVSELVAHDRTPACLGTHVPGPAPGSRFEQLETEASAVALRQEYAPNVYTTNLESILPSSILAASVPASKKSSSPAVGGSSQAHSSSKAELSREGLTGSADPITPRGTTQADSTSASTPPSASSSAPTEPVPPQPVESTVTSSFMQGMSASQQIQRLTGMDDDLMEIKDDDDNLLEGLDDFDDPNNLDRLAAEAHLMAVCSAEAPEATLRQSELKSLLQDAGAVMVPVIDAKEVEMGEIIGKGGYGHVYRGQWRQQEVAIKIMKVGGKTEDILKEISIMSKIYHPNIVRFFGCSNDGENLMILAEYVELGSLYDLLSNPRSSLTSSQIKRIAVGLAQGVKYLHSQVPVLIHRDLKSMNVLVTRDYQAKICDFGLSRMMTHTARMTRIGTVQWAAPEILLEEGYNEKCDVYSFSIVMYELLAKEVPYSGMTSFQVAQQVALKGLRPRLPRGIPPALQRLVKSCWNPKPNLRPSFETIVNVLNSIPDSAWPAKVPKN